MRFMLIVKATGYSEAGVQVSREHGKAMIAYYKCLARAGALLAAEELLPSSSGVRIKYRIHGSGSGEPEVKAGPFPTDRELIAGYTLIEVTTEDEAVDWALRMPVPISRGTHEIEIRKLKDCHETVRDPRTLAMEADLEDQINILKKIDQSRMQGGQSR